MASIANNHRESGKKNIEEEAGTHSCESEIL